jgi:tetratricopeptide (TPR) repeat protein
MRQITILFLLLAINCTAQEPELQKAIQLYDDGQLDDSKKIFSTIIANDSNNLLANQYLGYIWYEKYNHDSTVFYLNKAIKLNPDNAELYFVRGMSNYIFDNWPTPHKACDDFRTATSLGFYDSTIDSLMNSICWKHDDIWIKEEGLQDSSIIDSIYELLPKDWSIYELSDQNSLVNSDQDLDLLSKYYMTITNLELNYIDPVWSETSELQPSITILVTKKNLYKKIKKIVDKRLKNLKEDEALNVELVKGKDHLLIFRCYSEIRLERSANTTVREQYYLDKKEIIENFSSYEW